MREEKLKKTKFLHLGAFFYLHITSQNAGKQLLMQAVTHGENDDFSLLKKKVNMYFLSSFFFKLRKRQLQLPTYCKERAELVEMHFVLGGLSRDAQEQLTEQNLRNKIMLVDCGSIIGSF